jgi:epoxide hydrolase-like predicted phosphatase
MRTAETVPVEAVIFDYAGVLSTTPFAGTAQFEEAMGYPPGSVARLLFGDYFDGADEDAARQWHELERGRGTVEEWLASAVARAPALLGRDLDIAEWIRHMRTSPFGVHWMMIAKARELRGAGCGTAIITNNVREFSAAWRESIPIDEFDVVIDSCAVGLRKPEPEIYELTCRQLGVTPAAAVFLDDNARNVEAARALGMEGVLVGADPWAAIDELDAIVARRARPS